LKFSFILFSFFDFLREGKPSPSGIGVCLKLLIRFSRVTFGFFSLVVLRLFGAKVIGTSEICKPHFLPIKEELGVLSTANQGISCFCASSSPA
jgi:hypothetical protein